MTLQICCSTFQIIAENRDAKANTCLRLNTETRSCPYWECRTVNSDW